ncbi:LysR family transcriptional regulator [Pseudonocardia sp. GCM10023141]|uniref:LysR family transcriptional regulator n=1 Tax=Pseudonocardia sp. GCM10023141 TaxID=3252653 RepID=UPI0036177537
MRAVHIENVDLNLLTALEVLLDERHVSRAALRSHLSQSAMSRTLARLRTTFNDELLIRTAAGYELTPRAHAIQHELAHVMPRLRSLVRGDAFDPATATDTIRVACTDYAATVLGGTLFGRLFRAAPNLSLVIEPLSAHTFDDVEHGRVDLALSPVTPPAPLRRKALFTEDFVCALAHTHPFTGDRLTIDDVARYPHASVVVMHDDTMLVENRLAQLGVRPPPGLRVPYFSAAVAALPGTDLIAVLPRRFATLHAGPLLRTVGAPVEFTPFLYSMIWHPRLSADPAHTWFRALVQTAGDGLAKSFESDGDTRTVVPSTGGDLDGGHPDR